MSIGAVTGRQAPAQDPAEPAAQRRSAGTFQDALAALTGAAGRADDPQQALVDAILAKGLRAWAAERQYAELTARIREEVLAGMGLTEDDLLRMEESARAAVEQRIDEIIDQRMKAAVRKMLEEQLRRAAARSGLAL